MVVLSLTPHNSTVLLAEFNQMGTGLECTLPKIGFQSSNKLSATTWRLVSFSPKIKKILQLLHFLQRTARRYTSQKTTMKGGANKLFIYITVMINVDEMQKI